MTKEGFVTRPAETPVCWIVEFQPRTTELPLLLSRQGPVRHTLVQYEVRTARYNYTLRDGTTKPGCY